VPGVKTNGALLSTGLNSGDADYGRIVAAEGVHFILEDGRRVVDASNTGGPLGHAHPEIVEAVRRAAASPTINEGWLWPDREQAAQDLLEIAFAGEEDWAGAVRFFLSGSEANDLALSLAQAITGRAALATRERAYHGMTGLARAMTVQPHWHGGLSFRAGGVRAAPSGAPVVVLPGPEGARVGGAPHPRAAAALLDGADERLADVAAVLIDYTQGGIYYSPDYQDGLAAAARRAGALWIADEVITGLGRTGRWFAFQGTESRPDMVVLGKPLGGGGAPAAAVVLSKQLVERLGDASWQTYSTFRGHPLSVAAVRAHLKIAARDRLPERAAGLDEIMLANLRRLAEAHPSVARVDGRGLHWTVELHGPDWRDWRADTAQAPIATRVAARAAQAGALIGTSGEQTSLFLAPPLIIDEQDLMTIFAALDEGLAVADAELEASEPPR
jgi:4-aminobutyrate aminotransferase-like enzyme